MLKNFRLIALVFVFAASGFGASAQTTETTNYKDVLLDGKPAKLNLVTGEITFINGEIAKSRAAKKIQDSVLETRTEIKTNLITDISNTSETAQNVVITNATKTAKDSTKTIESKTVEQPLNNSETEVNNAARLLSNTSLISNQSVDETDHLVNSYDSNYHMVKRGETLYELARRYNTTLAQLKGANNLETTLIKAGETLRVRNFEPLDTDSDIIWEVSKGDTLYNIAKKNNTTVDDLKSLNGLSSNLIKIGQKLQVNRNSVITKK